MSDSITFYLPFGLERDGTVYRKGTMHLATTKDELEIQGSDAVGMNSRYRDVLLLARVIDEFEGLPAVSVDMIEELYEADFLYLQLLYKDLNGEAAEQVTVTCPQCRAKHPVYLQELYKDMSIFQQ